MIDTPIRARIRGLRLVLEPILVEEFRTAVVVDVTALPRGRFGRHQPDNLWPAPGHLRLGTITWSPKTGIVENLYVIAARRREGLGTLMFRQADKYQHRKKKPWLKPGPEPTALGAVFYRKVTKRPYSIIALAEPRTTQAEAAGARPRQLVPDNTTSCRLLLQGIEPDHRLLRWACQPTREAAQDFLR